MKFFVTGGAGFIGSNLVEALLARGDDVTVLDDLNDFYDPARKRRNIEFLANVRSSAQFKFVEGDIRDPRKTNELLAARRFDQIIHLAARAGVRPSLQDPVLYQDVNVTGTTCLLEIARKNGIEKITIASSSSVYGINAKTPFSESDPIFTPISPYAASKLACEALGHVYHHLYGMDIAMLRFFTVYGPRQRPDLAIYKFTELINSGRPITVYGDGTSARDYTYISDTVSGILACTTRQFGFEIFNLGESQTVQLQYLISLIENSLGKKACIDRQPMQPGDVPITFADITKARRILSYNPTVKIEEGIPRFVGWFKLNINSDGRSGALTGRFPYPCESV